MFGLFKRSKLESWEVELLFKTVSQLPDRYSIPLMNQLNEGILKGVITSSDDVFERVVFTYNPSVLKRYDNVNEKDYTIRNVKIYDVISRKIMLCEIYIASGTLCGYAIKNNGKKFKIDLSTIDVSECEIVYIATNEFAKLAQILDADIIAKLNPSQVYLVLVNDMEFYHIKDLEDGDFIGIDITGRPYFITHDPLDITPLDKSISEIMKGGGVI